MKIIHFLYLNGFLSFLLGTTFRIEGKWFGYGKQTVVVEAVSAMSCATLTNAKHIHVLEQSGDTIPTMYDNRYINMVV